jgi:activating signal cointegrator complex subunit 1
VIKGFSRKNVISAKNRLDLIVASGRTRIQFTHFLSIAFTSSEVQQNFQQFKNEILSDSDIFGIDESLFQVPQKLHLTIVTLALLDNEDRSVCAELLQDCKEMIIQPILRDELLKAKLMGLNYMNDDPSSVDVLYGKVASENLQEICNSIAEYFASRGYSQVKHDHVKLHVTLINSLFRDNDDAIEKDKEEARDNKDFKTRVTFDASKILKKYKDFYFGEIIVKEIHLSQRYSKSTNGYYESTGTLKL